jgi:ADP-ribose pyrophosphatase YjhB (NUDIX family)
VPEDVGVPPAFPVSVKGVVLDASDRVLLLRNDRDEWELPGGRIEIGETPQQCVVREIAEETRWVVRAGPLLDAWVYHVESVDRHVFVVAYGCVAEAGTAPVLSDEHVEVGLFDAREVDHLNLPEGYRRCVATWLADPRRAR